MIKFLFFVCWRIFTSFPLTKVEPSYIGIKLLVNVFQPTDSGQDAEKIDNDPTRHAEPWTDEDQACFSISIRSLNYQTLKSVDRIR